MQKSCRSGWRIKNGVAASEAEAIASDRSRQIEGRYPGDELVEMTLAEAELDASHYRCS